MSEDNPYRAPVSRPEPHRSAPSRVLGPIAAGLLAMVLATVLMGGMGLLGSILGVGSWWFSKFQRRSAPPEAPEVSAFLQQLEGTAPHDLIPTESDSPPESRSQDDPLGGIRL